MCVCVCVRVDEWVSGAELVCAPCTRACVCRYNNKVVTSLAGMVNQARVQSVVVTETYGNRFRLRLWLGRWRLCGRLKVCVRVSGCVYECVCVCV